MSNEAFEKWFENTVLNDNIYDVAGWAWQAAKADSESILSEQQNTIAELKAKVKDLEIQNVLYKDDELEGNIAIAELKAHINVLREALDVAKYELEMQGCDDKADDNAFLSYNRVVTVLLATPAQSLQAHDNEVIEKCAKVCESSDRHRGEYFAAKIRALKGK